MKHFDSFVFFFMAAYAVYLGVTGKEFYPGKLGGRSKEGKPVPLWFGRLWFLGFAGVLLYWAIKAY